MSEWRRPRLDEVLLHIHLVNIGPSESIKGLEKSRWCIGQFGESYHNDQDILDTFFSRLAHFDVDIYQYIERTHVHLDYLYNFNPESFDVDVVLREKLYWLGRKVPTPTNDLIVEVSEETFYPISVFGEKYFLVFSPSANTSPGSIRAWWDRHLAGKRPVKSTLVPGRLPEDLFELPGLCMIAAQDIDSPHLFEVFLDFNTLNTFLGKLSKLDIDFGELHEFDED